MNDEETESSTPLIKGGVADHSRAVGIFPLVEAERCPKHQYIMSFDGQRLRCKACVIDVMDHILATEELLAAFIGKLDAVNDSPFVSKFYEMTPGEEDILFNGWELRDGMVVLIAHDEFRQEVHPHMSQSELEKARRFNRWATISEVESGDVWVSFIATYSDGTKKKQQLDVAEAWFVKVDSLEDAEAQNVDQVDHILKKIDVMREGILTMVLTALETQRYHIGFDEEKQRTYADRVTRHIVQQVKRDDMYEKKIRMHIQMALNRQRDHIGSDDKAQYDHAVVVTEQILKLL